MTSNMREWIIPKGTTVKIGGVPYVLLNEATVLAAANPLSFVTQPSQGGDCEIDDGSRAGADGSFLEG